MAMNEGQLNRALVKTLRTELGPEYVVFKHFDRVTAGVPDISVTGRHLVTWFEVKYLTRGLIARGQQRLMLERLGAADCAWYVLYVAPSEQLKNTYIVHPRNVETFARDFVMMTEGFTHRLTVDFIRGRHA
jgi:hypothetical protein